MPQSLSFILVLLLYLNFILVTICCYIVCARVDFSSEDDINNFSILILFYIAYYIPSKGNYNNRL